MVAAVGSYLDAKAHAGTWDVRIDDLDPPRTVPGAAESILRCLEAFGMHPDRDSVFQSRRGDAYHAALHRLRSRGLAYPCGCTRREISEAGIAGIEGDVYPGTCRQGLPPGREAHAWRMRTEGARIEFTDILQGAVCQQIDTDIGDFVLYRAGHVFAYHLACAVDDAEQGITHVVRGADLLASTPRQIHLQRALGLPTPAYLHLPVAANAAGEKLSKQTLAPAVDTARPVSMLARVLEFLGHPPPSGLGDADLAALWEWAIAHWRRDRLPRLAIKVIREA
jgi:glutamyl-Q tRNA(Asp) synthetase